MPSIIGPPSRVMTALAQSVWENSSVVPVITRTMVLMANSTWIQRQTGLKRRKNTASGCSTSSRWPTAGQVVHELAVEPQDHVGPEEGMTP
jgi:hypothetical protein